MSTSHQNMPRPPFPREHISPPGIEENMITHPVYLHENYQGSNKLHGKVALITGGDSGIGRSVAIHFAIEGAKVVITYLPEEAQDAEVTKTSLTTLLPKELSIILPNPWARV